MIKYQKLSEELLKNIGGIENISYVTHCATRLRINYKKDSLVNHEALKTLPEAAGIVNKQGQLQVIIGAGVIDAYNEFLKLSGWRQENNEGTPQKEKYDGPKNVSYYLNMVGNFAAPVFMPVIPALIAGGLLVSLRVLLSNYFGMDSNIGTVQMMLTVFDAAFSFLPVYVGYSLATQLKMQPVMGGLLGAVMIAPRLASGTVTDFFGIPVPQISYSGTILPILIAVAFMYFVDKALKKILPETVIYFAKPLLTVIIVVPITLIVLGPIGIVISGFLAKGILWMTDNLGFISQPLLSILYPYMVMFGVDKVIAPIGYEMISTIGYNPLTTVLGFISNISIGGSALALASTIKRNKEKRGMVGSFGITALCGITEPAFYGALIIRPKALIGTAIGAGAAGLIAGIFGLRTFIAGGISGYFTLLAFIDPNGDMFYFWLAIVVGAVATVVSFLATRFIILADNKKGYLNQE